MREQEPAPSDRSEPTPSHLHTGLHGGVLLHAGDSRAHVEFWRDGPGTIRLTIYDENMRPLPVKIRPEASKKGGPPMIAEPVSATQAGASEWVFTGFSEDAASAVAITIRFKWGPETVKSPAFVSNPTSR